MDNTNFLQACYDGNNLLIKNAYLGKVDINFCDPSNGHGLYLAAAQGHESTVKLLLQHGAVDGLVMANTTSALNVAVFKGFFNIVTMLLEEASQPKVNLKTKTGETPLHSAAKKGFVNITIKLLEHGADPDSCTNDLHDTPLHYAAMKGTPNQQDALFQYFAIKSELGLFITSKKDYEEIICALLMASRNDNHLTKNRDDATYLDIAETNNWLNEVLSIQKSTLMLKKLSIRSCQQPPILNAFEIDKQKNVYQQVENIPEPAKKISLSLINKIS